MEDGGEEELWGREGPKAQKKVLISIDLVTRANFSLDVVFKLKESINQSTNKKIKVVDVFSLVGLKLNQLLTV